MTRDQRKGKRKQRSDFQRRAPELGHYFVMTDTDKTEKNYLQGLQESLNTDLKKRIVIKVKKTKTSDLVDDCKAKVAIEPQYAEPWIVFDRDQVKDFDEIIRKADREGIKAGWSNPCIEIWFDSYFEKMHSYQESTQCCEWFAKTFKRVTGAEYNKADRDIYTILSHYGDEDKAIMIAENRLKDHIESGIKNPSDMMPATTLHHLVDGIRRRKH